MDRAFRICCEVTEDEALSRPAFGCVFERACSLNAMDGCAERGLGADTGLSKLGMGWKGGNFSVLIVDARDGRCEAVSCPALWGYIERKLESRGGKWLPWPCMAMDFRLALLFDRDTSELRLLVRSTVPWAWARTKAAVAAATACWRARSGSNGSKMGGGCLCTVDVDLERRRRVPASLEARASIGVVR